MTRDAGVVRRRVEPHGDPHVREGEPPGDQVAGVVTSQSLDSWNRGANKLCLVVVVFIIAGKGSLKGAEPLCCTMFH